MSTQHTPGPWKISHDRRGTLRVYAGQHEIVRALSEHGTRRLTKAERDANRRLIAEAPEMANLLREAVHALEAHGGGTGECARHILAILARIEGKAS